MSVLEFSIIVPCYNVSEYLRQTVESIVCQSKLNLEIILIDDGSTDGTSIICDELATMDSRIKVIHQENAGLSGARNAGVEISSGKYVMFVDADDTIENDTFMVLSKYINETPVDILFFGYNQQEVDGRVFSFSPVSKPIFFYDKEEFLKFFAKNIDNCDVNFDFSSASGKIIRADLVKENRFPAEWRYGEDRTFNISLFDKSASFLFIPNCFYNYIKRKNSITTGKCKFSYIKDVFSWCLATKTFYKENKLMKYKKHLNNRFHQDIYNILMAYVDSKDSFKDLKKLTQEEKSLLSFSVIFADGFHPREILFLLKCKMSMF